MLLSEHMKGDSPMDTLKYWWVLKGRETSISKTFVSLSNFSGHRKDLRIQCRNSELPLQCLENAARVSKTWKENRAWYSAQLFFGLCLWWFTARPHGFPMSQLLPFLRTHVSRSLHPSLGHWGMQRKIEKCRFRVLMEMWEMFLFNIFLEAELEKTNQSYSSVVSS